MIDRESETAIEKERKKVIGRISCREKKNVIKVRVTEGNISQ